MATKGKGSSSGSGSGSGQKTSVRDSFNLTPTTSGSKAPATKPAKPSTTSSSGTSGKKSS
jgi:hypothetical protein